MVNQWLTSFNYWFNFFYNHLNQVNFLTWIPYSDALNCNLLDLFLAPDPSYCSVVVFSPLGKPNHAVISASIDFKIIKMDDAPFHCKAFHCPQLIRITEMFCGRIYLIWVLPLLLPNLVSGFKCTWLSSKVLHNPSSSLKFSPAYNVAIFNRNHFFH